MKIEKLNDHQIRCTLTSEDLIERQLKLSELAYGTEKAKRFFQDMMEQANTECGFDAENIPLMIEAIPASPDSIVLVITKVDSLDALDAGGQAPHAAMPQAGLSEFNESMLPGLEEYNENVEPQPFQLVRIFNFQSLDDVIHASHMMRGIYNGSNSLYKDTETGDYLLVLTKDRQETAEFFKLCNILSEYGVQNPSSGSTLAFLEEHCALLVGSTALQTLASF